MSNKNKSSKRNQRKSLKGKWGHIGAPPKAMRFPKRPFVMAALFALNAGLCELTVRKNVDKAIADGTILALKPLSQKGGSVGRPKSRFVLKERYDAAKMELAPVKADVTATPAPIVTTETPAPVTATVAPAPKVETVTSVAEPTPAAPAPIEAPVTPAAEPVAIETIATPSVPVTETPATPAIG